MDLVKRIKGCCYYDDDSSHFSRRPVKKSLARCTRIQGLQSKLLEDCDGSCSNASSRAFERLQDAYTVPVKDLKRVYIERVTTWRVHYSEAFPLICGRICLCIGPKVVDCYESSGLVQLISGLGCLNKRVQSHSISFIETPLHHHHQTCSATTMLTVCATPHDNCNRSVRRSIQ